MCHRTTFDARLLHTSANWYHCNYNEASLYFQDTQNILKQNFYQIVQNILFNVLKRTLHIGFYVSKL